MEIENAALGELARRLLHHPTITHPKDESPITPGVAAFQKLHHYLTKLVGVAGFHALLSRALSKAKKRSPSLAVLSLKDDGTLEGFENISPSQVTEALDFLLAQVLELLVTFVGEKLTFQLVRDVWPDVPLEKIV